MRVCALDISKSFVGIAISSHCQKNVIFSFSIKTKQFQWNQLAKYEIEHTIIGLATHKDKNLTENGLFTIEFCKQKIIGSTEFICEWYTTKLAAMFIERYKIKKTKDELSAIIMLTKYCNMSYPNWN